MPFYFDPSMPGTLIVESDGVFFAVPRIHNGWEFRSPYRLDPTLRSARLKPATARRAAGLGIPDWHNLTVADDDAQAAAEVGKLYNGGAGENGRIERQTGQSKGKDRYG